MEEGRWEPGSGFEILVGLDVGCKKQRTGNDDSKNSLLQGLNHELMWGRPWKKEVRTRCAGIEERV